MVSLADMKVNEAGVIRELGGGEQFQAKMHSLNIRVGKKIKKNQQVNLKRPCGG